MVDSLHKTTAPLRDMESVWRKLLVLIEFPWNAMRNWMGIRTPCSGWIELTLTGQLNSQIQWIYHGTDDVNIYCCTILPDHQAYCDFVLCGKSSYFYYNTFFVYYYYNCTYLAFIALVSFKHQEILMFGSVKYQLCFRCFLENFMRDSNTSLVVKV